MRWWMQRAVGIALIAVVAGAPALAVACAALCGHDTTRGGHATTAVAASAPSCGHPGSGPDADGRVTRDGHPSGIPAQELTAPARGCCGADAALSASLAAGRADAHAWTAASTAATRAALRGLTAARTAPIHSPAVSPPSPSRAPLVLRV